MSPPDRMPWAFVSALSMGQLVSFGTIFYAFALFIEPMGQELGWGKSELTAAYSLALGTSAFCAVPVGRLIDLGHGRAVMTGGFASTVFIPLTHLLIAHYGWRGTLLILAGLNLLLCAVPHALSIPRAPS